MAQNDIDVNVKVDGASVANQANAASTELNEVVKKHRDQLGMAVSRLTTFATRLGGLSGALNKTISTFMGTGGVIAAAGLVATALMKAADMAEEYANRIQGATAALDKLYNEQYSDRMRDMRQAISEGRWTESDENVIASEKDKALNEENDLRLMRDQLLKNLQNARTDKGVGLVRTFQQFGRQDIVQELAYRAEKNQTTLEEEVQKWISSELDRARKRLREVEAVETELANFKKNEQDRRDKALEEELKANERLRQKEDAFREKQHEEQERAVQKEIEAGEELQRREEAFREKLHDEQEKALQKELDEMERIRIREDEWRERQHEEDMRIAHNAFNLPQMTSLSNKGIYMGETTNATIADPTFQMQKNIWNSVQGIQQLLR